MEIFQKKKELKKEIMPAMEIKIWQTQIEKEKKNIWKIIAIEQKKWMNELINCVEKLENFSPIKSLDHHFKISIFSKLIKYRK